jgi:hypothetical protein
VSGFVWKSLSPEELAAFREHLACLPMEGGPRYGLLGVKASWWTRLGGGARPFVVLLAGGRLALSKRSFHTHRGVSRHQYRLADLRAMKVRRGPVLESVRFTFADGYRLRVGGLPRWQSRPLELYLGGGVAALDPARLTPEQLTNFCQAMAAVGLWPARGAPGPAEA